MTHLQPLLEICARETRLVEIEARPVRMRAEGGLRGRVKGEGEGGGLRGRVKGEGEGGGLRGRVKGEG